MVSPPVDHVIVLALTKRSFDHVLGFVPHVDPLFDGPEHGGPYANPPWRGGATPIPATPDAPPILPVDPDNSHEAVMRQLRLKGRGAGRRATNQGFVASYEETCRGIYPPAFKGLLGPLANRWLRRASANPVRDSGGLIMRCQHPSRVPVVAVLALQFGVCSKWFASVPGQTWPNRNFMHAATSDWTTNNEGRFYVDPTIFELLESHGKRWHIYYDGVPQVWAFRNLWAPPERIANWFVLSEFARHVEEDRLPSYSFIEPRHVQRDRDPAEFLLGSRRRPPLPTAVPPVGGLEQGDEQPGNDPVADSNNVGQPGASNGEFERDQQVVAALYEALRSNPSVFERSIMLVTYDEHGGFYDHVPPPTGVPPPVGRPPPGALGMLLRFLLARSSADFNFTMLGGRVPALVVSPYVPAGTVSAEVYDHASIPATVRALFAPQAAPLTRRDKEAKQFHLLLTLQQPRRGDDLPDLSSYLEPGALSGEATLTPESVHGAEPPQYYREFLELVSSVLPVAEARTEEVAAAFTAKVHSTRSGNK
jgi:phospholipase C